MMCLLAVCPAHGNFEWSCLVPFSMYIDKEGSQVAYVQIYGMCGVSVCVCVCANPNSEEIMQLHTTSHAENSVSK